ncbi:MAG: T9SS type A sorting domain-containing protein [Bacteroidota bacterium]
MKNILNIIFSTALMLSFCSQTNAERYHDEKPNKGLNQTKSALCVPATGSNELNINNVRARINTGGDMWWDFSVSKYEIPKGSRKTSMFSGSLWIGGLDVNGQLKLAALRYRQSGNDYWPGPLTIDGTAAVDQETCDMYDKHFKITRSEVESFKSYFDEHGTVPANVPKSIKEWPGNGDVTKNQAYMLAPFYDRDSNDVYEWEKGDYPYYDFANALCPRNPENAGKKVRRAAVKNGMVTDPADTMGILVDQVLKGDQTLWWVFNDKGNAHTETKGEPIGLEIRAQAFAFATNDEINNMTFYSYEIINRSTYTLTETYFSQWVDTDLGDPKDDYVGCDVLRGLGYCYNGKDPDGTGRYDEYGAQPPAIGVDFFQGPYMDPDGLDNPAYNVNTPLLNCNEAINGVNFGDGIVDNERFGMRRFVYHNNSGSGGIAAMTDPDIAIEYYNLLKGIWKDGQKMRYGGNAHPSSSPPAYGPDCDFMFPGETDPCNWGTGLQPPNGLKNWTEEIAHNVPYDRRFMQSAGPFTLRPGAVNYITVGIPWARASSGGPFASVELLRKVDDKCQTLFDNCFKVVDGPDAPDLSIQELDKQLILYVSNRKGSNNYNESYKELDPSIPVYGPDSSLYDRYYRFEGYQIFQVKNATVSVADIKDNSLARLVLQCDIKNFDKNTNPIGQLVNYYYSDQMGGSVPYEEVNGTNTGIKHSFTITEDKFAVGTDTRLINHKQYYFIAIAYAYNNYAKYSQDPNVLNGLYGQTQPYKAGRKSATGAIASVVGIPHIVNSESYGTVQNCSYAAGPKITRIEGQGNGGLVLDMTQASIDKIMQGAPWKNDNPQYLNNKGPVDIKVIDPLNVVPGDYTLKFVARGPSGVIDTNNVIDGDSTGWILLYNNAQDTVYSDKSIEVANEQLVLDLGISLNIFLNPLLPLYPDYRALTWPTCTDIKMLESSFTFADSSHQWLAGVPDVDGIASWNWIRSGTVKSNDTPTAADLETEDYAIDVDAGGNRDLKFLDPTEQFEKILQGTWAPYRMCSKFTDGPQFNDAVSQTTNKLNNLASVNVVITSDKSKWTRCPVIELEEDPLLSEGGANKFDLRKGQSVDKDGNPDGTGTGMSWFPGYAINIETGERLNMMFGEDSWQIAENGRDMKFNPTSHYTTPLGGILFGGKHYVYVMGHNQLDALPNPTKDCPAYDEGAWIHANLVAGGIPKKWVYANAMWVGIPMAVQGETWLANDVKLRLRIGKPYARNYATSTNVAANPQNNNYPMYTFTTGDIATSTSNNEQAKSALDLINVVPNPYYAFSKYETSQIDNRVKIVNLPVKCTISIYSVNGTLIRQFKKDDNVRTSVDWDLKNHAGIPISGGVYIIHVKAEGIGEKVIKWFGVLRPTDLNSF